jgi:hypothetical protein
MGWKLPGGRRPEHHHLFPPTPPATGLQEPVFVSAQPTSVPSASACLSACLLYLCPCHPHATSPLTACFLLICTFLCSVGLQAGVVYKADGLDLAVHAQLLGQGADVAAPGGGAAAGVVGYLGGHQVGWIDRAAGCPRACLHACMHWRLLASNPRASVQSRKPDLLILGLLLCLLLILVCRSNG